MKLLAGRCTTPRSTNASASAGHSTRPGHDAGKIFCKALLLAGALSVGGLAVPSAQAGLLIRTSGIIESGSETGGLFGLPLGTTSLAGDAYTLKVEFDELGPDYFTDGDGNVAEDTENSPGMTGFVIATINGHSIKTSLTNSLGSSLFEDLFDFDASNEGFSGDASTGDFVNVFQELSCSSPCVPFANLIARFNYTLGPDDVGTDLYTFEAGGFPASGTQTADFVGTQTGFAFVPEPASWVLLATGLLGLAMRTRRRA